MSVTNSTQLIGRLTKDPVRFDNADGSASVKYTIAIDRDYTTRAGERETDFIPAETYIRSEQAQAGKFGAFPYLGAGDLVAVAGQLRSYVSEKGGQTVYGLTLDVRLSAIEMLESKATTQARRAKVSA